ncbi:MAG: hypothetical protein ICV59_07480 [Thermoleophilia bacterium]|nr:hypothetical protein [Thermoleophilia bacterium]
MTVLALVQRSFGLGAVALLCAVGALAIVEQRTDEPDPPVLPESVPAPGGGWYEGPAAPRLAETAGERTACGFVVRARTAGVAHPVLPCGAKIFVAFGSREVLTQVIARRTPAGTQFAVSAALAKLLGLRSTDIVRWRFASTG